MSVMRECSRNSFLDFQFIFSFVLYKIGEKIFSFQLIKLMFAAKILNATSGNYNFTIRKKKQKIK